MMNKLLQISILVISCFLSKPECHADPLGPKPNELVITKGFQLSITSPSQEFQGGSAISIDASIKNMSDKSQSLLINSDIRTYKIEITTEKGEKVPLTRYGQQMINGLKPTFAVGPLDLAPGRECKASLPISRLYDMSVSGVYLVKVKHGIQTETDRNFVDATSNVLRIELK